MIRIGILGDIGSGKTFVANNFGYPVFNADLVVSNLYQKDKFFRATADAARRAVLDSSPLPLPNDPEIFESKIVLHFEGDNE